MYDYVEINREPIDGYPLEGFLLERSNELVLLNVTNSDLVCFNGYSVIRRRDVRKMKVRKTNSFMIRALQLRGLTAIPPREISIASWPELLESINKQFPLFTIHQEWLDNEVCYVGRLAARTATTFGLKEIDPDTRWTRSRSYKFSDLTKVDFGGGYETALADLASTPTKRKAQVRAISGRIPQTSMNKH